MIRILFTGGGTGGHIYPIIAVVEELKNLAAQKNQEIDLRYLGVPGDYKIVLEKNGVRVSKILSSKLRRYFDLRNALDLPKFIISISQALWKVLWIMPDVLFSKGGPGALPIILACRFYRVPIIIHESDAIPGLVNQVSAKRAKRIGISFNHASRFFPGNNVALVGNPVRPSLLEKKITGETAKKNFGFDTEKPLILAMGGSQGSSRINDFFMDIAPELVKNFQVLHQTGKNNFEEVRREFAVITAKSDEEEKRMYRLVPYLDNNLDIAYSAADLVVSRSGSGSIFEIAAFGKPSILIPLPEAAGNHQIVNAYEYAKSGASIVIEEENLKPSIFLSQVKKIFSEPDKIKTMGESAKKFFNPQSAKIIAKAIVEIAET